MKVPLVGRRPWLLVWAAFLLLVVVWAAAFAASRRIPGGMLTPAQEAAVLEKRRAP